MRRPLIEAGMIRTQWSFSPASSGSMWSERALGERHVVLVGDGLGHPGDQHAPRRASHEIDLVHLETDVRCCAAVSFVPAPARKTIVPPSTAKLTGNTMG